MSPERRARIKVSDRMAGARRTQTTYLDVLIGIIVDHDLADNVSNVFWNGLSRNSLDQLRHPVGYGEEVRTMRSGGNDNLTTHGIFNRSSSFFFGIHEEYNILTPDESIVISSLCSVLNFAMSSSRVRSPSMKNRSQIVHSLS